MSINLKRKRFLLEEALKKLKKAPHKTIKPQMRISRWMPDAATVQLSIFNYSQASWVQSGLSEHPALSFSPLITFSLRTRSNLQEQREGKGSLQALQWQVNNANDIMLRNDMTQVWITAHIPLTLHGNLKQHISGAFFPKSVFFVFVPFIIPNLPSILWWWVSLHLFH